MGAETIVFTSAAAKSGVFNGNVGGKKHYQYSTAFLGRIAMEEKMGFYDHQTEHHESSDCPEEGQSKCKCLFKFLAAVFWDAQSILLVDFLEGQRMIPSVAYKSGEISRRFRRKKHPRHLHQKALLHLKNTAHSFHPVSQVLMGNH